MSVSNVDREIHSLEGVAWTLWRAGTGLPVRPNSYVIATATTRRQVAYLVAEKAQDALHVVTAEAVKDISAAARAMFPRFNVGFATAPSAGPQSMHGLVAHISYVALIGIPEKPDEEVEGALALAALASDGGYIRHNGVVFRLVEPQTVNEFWTRNMSPLTKPPSL